MNQLLLWARESWLPISIWLSGEGLYSKQEQYAINMAAATGTSRLASVERYFSIVILSLLKEVLDFLFGARYGLRFGWTL